MLVCSVRTDVPSCACVGKCVSLGHLIPCLSGQLGRESSLSQSVRLCLPVKSQLLFKDKHTKPRSKPMPTPVTLHGYMHIYSSALCVKGAREKNLEMAAGHCFSKQHTSLSLLESFQSVHTLNIDKHNIYINITRGEVGVGC